MLAIAIATTVASVHAVALRLFVCDCMRSKEMMPKNLTTNLVGQTKQAVTRVVFAKQSSSDATNDAKLGKRNGADGVLLLEGTPAEGPVPEPRAVGGYWKAAAIAADLL